MASSASVMRCRAESVPIDMSVPNMSLSIEPTSPATARNPYSSATEGAKRPSATNSSASEPHSSRKTCAPVKLPSPPMTTSRFMPWRSRLCTALLRPSLVRKSGLRAVPSSVPPCCSTPPTESQVNGRIWLPPSIIPCKPSNIPKTCAPRSNAARTAERTAAFMPCASPPLVRTPRRAVFAMCRPPIAANRLLNAAS